MSQRAMRAAMLLATFVNGQLTDAYDHLSMAVEQATGEDWLWVVGDTKNDAL